MKFGPASPADAIGGVTVHTLRQGSLVLKKGTTVGPAEVEALKKTGVKEIVVVRLEKGDVSEDEAAASIAQAVAGEGVNVERAFTGRSNLFAAKAGVLVVDRAAVDRINGVDEAITFATLSAFKPVVSCSRRRRRACRSCLVSMVPIVGERRGRLGATSRIMPSPASLG